MWQALPVLAQYFENLSLKDTRENFRRTSLWTWGTLDLPMCVMKERHYERKGVKSALSKSKFSAWQNNPLYISMKMNDEIKIHWKQKVTFWSVSRVP